MFITSEYSRAFPPPIKYAQLWHPSGTYQSVPAGVAGPCDVSHHGNVLVQLGGARGSFGYPDELVGWPVGPDALFVRKDIALEHFGDISLDVYTRWVVDYYWRGGQADSYMQDVYWTMRMVSADKENLLRMMNTLVASITDTH